MDLEQSKALAFHFYKLESEASAMSNEDTESVNSFQEIETDLVKDSSDTERDDSEYEIEYEYEVESESCCDSNSVFDTSGDSDLEHDWIVAAAAICDSSFEQWVTDGEDSDLSSSEDYSFERKDFWTCIKCKSKKKNPLFSHCEKCFQDRKTLFPPRPKPKKPKKNKKNDPPVALASLRSCLNGLSQDSGIGSSQECPPLGLDQIVIPDHLAAIATDVSSIVEEGVSSPQTSTVDQVTLDDVAEKKSTRKRQLSESSLSEVEGKRPRWRDVKRSPKRSTSSSESPTRKRDAIYDVVETLKKINSVEQSNLIARLEDDLFKPQTNFIDCNPVTIDISGKTSDLGSEISSSSGLFDKLEEFHAPLVECKDICIFCNTKPINAGFLHGNLAHRCCCYQCAKKTWKSIKRCPMCNRKVSNVIRVY